MTKLCSAWFGVGAVGLLALQGCGSVCGDDGFAWQQKDNPACLANTESNSNTESAEDSETESASTPTESASTPTESNSNSETESNSNSETESNSETTGEGPFCADADGDGFGDPNMCMGEMFPGSVPNDDDCVDTDPNTFPGAAENDSMTACMTDADDDGFGDPSPDFPGVEPGTDCDDSNANTFPGSAENEADPTACMQDEDDDGFGDDDPDQPPGADPEDPPVVPGTDCDDGNIFTFPGSAPNDSADACMTDEDDDDWGDDNPGPGIDPGTDCADYDEVQHVDCTGCEPGGAECNGSDLEECNAEGTEVTVTPCSFGCDDVGEKCWDELTVDAGVSECIAPNDPVQLGAMAMGGDGNYTWEWTPAADLDDATIPNPLAMPPGPTDYVVTVTDGEGNVAMDTVSVFLQNQVLPFDPDVCEIFNFPFDQVPQQQDPQPNWMFNDATQTLCQTVNAKASALFCGWTLDNAQISGRFGVGQTNDDDWVGFMWGIQDTDHFYLFQWKRLAQANYAGCAGGQIATETGMTVKRIDVQDPNATPLSCVDIHGVGDTPNATTLLSPAEFYDQGWQVGTDYVFDLTHLANGDMTIEIRRADNDMVVANTMFNDMTYASGQFGMYTKSQEDACFAGFEVDCL